MAGRPKLEKYKFAGERLRLLREKVYCCSQIDLVDMDRWKKDIVKIKDEKTLSKYENNGIPTSKLNAIAEFFYLHVRTAQFH